MKEPDFSVCMMARETKDVIERFANHYKRLGAAQVRVFFDGEADEVPACEGVDITVCDRNFWEKNLGHEPKTLGEGMLTVFQYAHESARTEWQLFCDADEFLVVADSVPNLLAQVPDDQDALRILNLEAVWGPGDPFGEPFSCTYFRRILSKRNQSVMKFLLPLKDRSCQKQGLIGHRGGKHFLRRGTVVEEYNSHYSIQDGKPFGIWAHEIGFDIDQVFLAHFDAISEKRWTEKWRRRISNERPSNTMGPQRRAQVEAIKQAADAGKMNELFRDFYGISGYETFLLQRIDALRRANVFDD